MDDNYKRRLGDRHDGRRIRSLTPLNRLSPYIIKNRCDASGTFSDSADISEAERFVKQKQSDGYTGFSLLHLVVACYVRTVSLCPEINRFISGQHFYARHGIDVIFAVKRESLSVSETIIKIRFDTLDTVFDVYRRISDAIDALKADSSETSAERFAASLIKLPGFTLRLVIWFLGLLDYFGMLPEAILSASPYHGSLYISELSGISSAPLNHHLYNFGNIPVNICLGSKRASFEPDDSGKAIISSLIDLSAAIDTRICDSRHYVAALKGVKYFLRNPRFLEFPPEQLVEDVF